MLGMPSRPRSVREKRQLGSLEALACRTTTAFSPHQRRGIPFSARLSRPLAYVNVQILTAPPVANTRAPILSSARSVTFGLKAPFIVAQAARLVEQAARPRCGPLSQALTTCIGSRAVIRDRQRPARSLRRPSPHRWAVPITQSRKSG
jgi:hypothetical protein